MKTFAQTRGEQFEYAVEGFLSRSNIPFTRVGTYRCKCGRIFNKTAKGFPDFFLHSMNLAIECKTGKAVLTKEQKIVKKDMERGGIEYIILRDTVDALLERFNCS